MARARLRARGQAFLAAVNGDPEFLATGLVNAEHGEQVAETVDTIASSDRVVYVEVQSTVPFNREPPVYHRRHCQLLREASLQSRSR